jgi:hypothetical protein
MAIVIIIISTPAPRSACTMVAIVAVLDFLVLIANSPYQVATLVIQKELVMALVIMANPTPRIACTMVAIAALLHFLVLIAVSPFQIATLTHRKALVITFVKICITPPNVDLTAGTASTEGIHCGAPKRRISCGC